MLIVFGALAAVAWNTLDAYNIVLFGVKVRRLGGTALERLGFSRGVSKSYVGWSVYCVQPTEAIVKVRTHRTDPWTTGRCYEVTHTPEGDEYREWPVTSGPGERVQLPFFAVSLEVVGGDPIDVYKELSKFAFRGNTLDAPFWDWFSTEIAGVTTECFQGVKVLSSKTFAVTSLDTENAIEL